MAPRARAFAHHAGRPLPIDVLVVDEASMLDLALATHLLEAVPEAARIVLLGDKDQLAAVESGAVFADLSAQRAWSAPARQALAEACGVAVAALAGVAPEVAAPEEGAEAHADAVGSASPAAGAALADAVVWLTHSHRFAADSPIGLLAREVAAGRSDDAIARLRGSDGSVLRWIEGGDDTAAGEILDPSPAEAMRRGLDDYLQALRRDPADHAAVFEAFGRTRVRCAVREGPRGVRAVNDALQRDLRRALREVPHAASGDLGRPILVLRNDEALGLFNGDLGLVLPGPGVAQAVVFPDGAGGFRAVPAARLPEHETAFAMTVHKAQGSEFDHAIVLLPGRRSRVVTRELLYTAITRARRSVTVVGSAVVVAAAIATPTRREGGLAARLREAATAAGGAG